MMDRIKNIDSDAFNRVLLLMILGFTGITAGLTNLNQFDTRNVIQQVEKSATSTEKSAMNTEQILESGRTRTVLLSELNETQRVIEETRQNQTERLLPVFFRQANETDLILNNTEEIKRLLENISEAINN